MMRSIRQFVIISTVLIIISYLFYIRVLQVKEVKNLIYELDINERYLFLWLHITFFYVLIYQFIFVSKSMPSSSLKIFQIWSKTLIEFDNYIKSIKIIGSFIERILWKIKTYGNNSNFIVILFGIMNIMPKIIILLILIYDVFFLSQIYYFYKALPLLFMPLTYSFIKISLSNEWNNDCDKIEPKILIQTADNKSEFLIVISVRSYVTQTLIAQNNNNHKDFRCVITPSYELIKSTINLPKKPNWKTTITKFKIYLDILVNTKKSLDTMNRLEESLGSKITFLISLSYFIIWTSCLL